MARILTRSFFSFFSLQLTLAVRGVLEKYLTRSLDQEVAEAVLRDLENVLYDEMIFDRIIEQVDRSYAVSPSPICGDKLL